MASQNALIQESENLDFDTATIHKLYVYYHEINSFHYESIIQMRSFDDVSIIGSAIIQLEYQSKCSNVHKIDKALTLCTEKTHLFDDTMHRKDSLVQLFHIPSENNVITIITHHSIFQLWTMLRMIFCSDITLVSWFKVKMH